MNPRLLVGLIALAFSHAPAAEPLSAADLVEPYAALIENKTLQGVSICVIRPNGVVNAHAGSLAPENPTTPDDETLYEIGSITKVFTSLLLAEAVVRGEVSLDTTLAELLPADVALPENTAQKITLRMLATHTSGLPAIPVEIPPDDYTNPYASFDEADLWASLQRVKLDFEPGAKAGYSNLAAGLLGTLLSRRAHMTFPELVANRITRPLGMKDTVIDPDAALRARFAPPFNAAGQPSAYWDFKALAGAGGIRSTLADMRRFAEAMLHPENTPLQKAIELCWQRQPVAAALYPGGQALGWILAGDGRTRWHNGMTGGFHAALFVNRELGIAAIFLSNRSTPIGTELTGTLFRRAAGRRTPPMPNRDRPEIALTAEQLDRCVGTFRLNPRLALVFERRNLALFVTPTGQSSDRLYAASADTFFSRRVAAELVFELPSGDAPATALVFKQGSKEVRAVRETE